MTAPDVAAALARLREDHDQVAAYRDHTDCAWCADLALLAQALAEREDAEMVARRLYEACPVTALCAILPWDQLYARERGYWLTMARALETPHPQPKETQ